MKKTLIIAFALIALVGLQADAQVSHSSTNTPLAVPDNI